MSCSKTIKLHWKYKEYNQWRPGFEWKMKKNLYFRTRTASSCHSRKRLRHYRQSIIDSQDSESSPVHKLSPEISSRVSAIPSSYILPTDTRVSHSKDKLFLIRLPITLHYIIISFNKTLFLEKTWFPPVPLYLQSEHMPNAYVNLCSFHRSQFTNPFPNGTEMRRCKENFIAAVTPKICPKLLGRRSRRNSVPN